MENKEEKKSTSKKVWKVVKFAAVIGGSMILGATLANEKSRKRCGDLIKDAKDGICGMFKKSSAEVECDCNEPAPQPTTNYNNNNYGGGNFQKLRERRNNFNNNQ